jgi:hypothetical protein
MTTPKDTWISVKDAMPPKNKLVLFHLEGNSFLLGKINNNDNYVDNMKELIFDFEKITHWMLLSKPKTTN